MTDGTNDLPARNLGGRPKGSKDRPNKTARLMEKLASSNKAGIEKIIDTTVKLAEAGEPWAAQALLNRLWPVPKGRPVKLNLSGDNSTAIERVMAALEAGEISAGEAGEFISVIKARSEMVEAADMLKRVAALEKDAGQ